jgi:hypothetical protein
MYMYHKKKKNKRSKFIVNFEHPSPYILILIWEVNLNVMLLSVSKDLINATLTVLSEWFNGNIYVIHNIKGTPLRFFDMMGLKIFFPDKCTTFDECLDH